MNRKFFITVIGTLILLVSSSYGKKMQFKGEAFNTLNDTTQKMLLLNIDSVTIEYYDNTRLNPNAQFSDSFFIEAANNLFHFELRKTYPVVLIDSGDSQYKLSDYNSYSVLKKTGSEKEVGERIKAIALKYDVSFVLVPQFVFMKHITSKPQGWRDSPSYEHPVNYKAIAKINIQIWSKDGELLLENGSHTDTGRPVLYKIVNRKKKNKENQDDIADFAKRFYSPPIVRVLNKAIIKSLRF